MFDLAACNSDAVKEIYSRETLPTALDLFDEIIAFAETLAHLSVTHTSA